MDLCGQARLLGNVDTCNLRAHVTDGDRGNVDTCNLRAHVTDRGEVKAWTWILVYRKQY
jgi:hypothetical protein